MGRTAPPARVLVEAELDRLRRVAGALRDPGDREALERAIRAVYRVLEAYRYVPMRDPLEPLLIAVAVTCLGKEGVGPG